jgi:hypothetical protein
LPEKAIPPLQKGIRVGGLAGNEQHHLRHDSGKDHHGEEWDPEARSLLPWVAALGRAFDVPTLVQVMDRPAPEIVEAIDRLERRGILRATGPDRYDFTHSLLRQAAYRRRRTGRP